MKILAHHPVAGSPLIGLVIICSLLMACALAPEGGPAQPKVDTEADALFQDAEARFDAGDFAAAIEGYNTYLLQAPQGRWAAASLIKVGAAYQRLERPLDALNSYQRVLTEFPDAPYATDAYLEMVELYAQTHRFDQLLELTPPKGQEMLSPGQKVRLFTLRGDAFLAQGYPADAYVQYRAALDLDGDTLTPTEAALTVAARLEESVRQLNLAENQLFLEGESHHGIHALLLYYLGLHQADAGQPDKAVETLSSFAGRYPDHPYIGRAFTLMEEFSHHQQFAPFTIGCLLPLSGPYAAYGKRALQGIELALSDWSTQNWHPMRLVVRDSRGETHTALEALTALAEEGVGAVIGPMVTAEAVAPKAQEMGLPIVAMTQKAGVAGIGSYIFRNFMTPEMQMQALGAYAVETLGLKRFAILYPREPYGERFMQQFWRAVAARGGEVTAVEAYDPKNTDFARPIKQLIGEAVPVDRRLSAPARVQDPRLQANARRGDGPQTLAQHLFASPTAWIMDGYRTTATSPVGATALEDAGRMAVTAKFEAIFLPDSPRKAGLIIPQLAYYDIRHAQLLGTNLWHSPQLLEMARKYVQGAIFTDGVHFETEQTVKDAWPDPAHVFRTAFKTIYTGEPDLIAATAYDTAEILFAIFSESEIRLRRDIKNRLNLAGPFPGITGQTTFSPIGEAQKALHLLQIQGRRFVELQRLLAPPSGPLPTDPPMQQDLFSIDGRYSGYID
ncbi:MAG: penicillin-binding protein activator [Desulfosarcinaceae bacterium]|nr:penicillin-binding protein activator [Desulfosarcinaceae bacterium]